MKKDGKVLLLKKRLFSQILIPKLKNFNKKFL